jgi:Domain of unknown function (DUF5667)
MTSVVDRFATLVEETGPGRHHRRPVDTDADLLALVRVAHDLGRSPNPPIRAEFREELHTRLLAEFARQQEAQTAAPVVAEPARRASQEKTQVVRQVRSRLGGRARLAMLAGVATGAIALSGVSLASVDAVPGDPLYSVKRSGEQAKLVFASSDANRGQLHLDFARTRLVEARQVAPAEVAGVLAEMDQETTEGVRLLFGTGMDHGEEAFIDSVTAFVSRQRGDLIELRATVRTQGDPARESLDLLDAVEIRANQLRAAIAEGCLDLTHDELGPKPAC